MTRLRAFLNKWFDGIGCIAAARITGDSSHYSIWEMDEFFNRAKTFWDRLTTAEQLGWYKDLLFEDHQAFNEREFVRALGRGKYAGLCP